MHHTDGSVRINKWKSGDQSVVHGLNESEAEAGQLKRVSAGYFQSAYGTSQRMALLIVQVESIGSVQVIRMQDRLPSRKIQR